MQVVSYELWVAIVRKQIYKLWVPFYERQIVILRVVNLFCELEIKLRVTSCFLQVEDKNLWVTSCVLWVENSKILFYEVPVALYELKV